MSDTAGSAGSAIRRNPAAPGSAWDRLVTFLKVALPLAALAVLLACIIWPLTARQEFSFILSKDRVAEADERLRVEKAVYRGEDTKGQPFTITAARAVQQSSDVPIVELQDIQAQLRTADGPARASARAARYDLEHETITAVGPVSVESSNGYRLDTSDVTVDLESKRVTGSGQVVGRMPLGSFKAGRMRADVTGRTVVLDRGASLRIVQR